MQSEFRNEPFTDFSKEENAQAMRAAIEKVKNELGQEYPLVIGGERIKTDKKFESFNPANKTQVVGRFQKATEELARRSVETAFETFQTWRNTPARERADILFRVAAILRERKHEMSAWMIHEVGKTWAEADGDTAEAIDFCEFYAHEMLRYAGDQPLTKLEGEDNHLRIYSARRRRSDSALEFSTGNHGRHDRRLCRDGQHSRPQTFFGCSDHRL
jgi:NAD-dependent aldehyde dehydrogenases